MGKRKRELSDGEAPVKRKRGEDDGASSDSSLGLPSQLFADDRDVRSSSKSNKNKNKKRVSFHLDEDLILNEDDSPNQSTTTYHNNSLVGSSSTPLASFPSPSTNGTNGVDDSEDDFEIILIRKPIELELDALTDVESVFTKGKKKKIETGMGTFALRCEDMPAEAFHIPVMQNVTMKSAMRLKAGARVRKVVTALRDVKSHLSYPVIEEGSKIPEELPKLQFEKIKRKPKLELDGLKERVITSFANS